MASFYREIILASAPDNPITAYDPLTGAALAHFSGSRSPRHGLALIGTTLIAASHISPSTASSGFIRLYNWWSSAALYSIPVSEPVAPIVATPDGAYLFAGGLSGQIHALSLPSGNICRSFRAQSQPISCLVIDEDGSLLISGSDDGMISVFPILRLLDASADEGDSAKLALYQFPAHSLTVTCIALGPGRCNSTIISSSLDGTCKFWSMANGTHLRTVRFPCAMWCVAVEPTNSVGYAGGSDGRVHVIPMQSRGRRLGVEVVAWEAEHSGAVMAVAMANGNKNLVSVSEDGIVRVWVVESRSVIRVFGHERGGGVSDLLVAKGMSSGGIRDEAVGPNGGRNLGFCEREICRKISEVGEMEEWLSVVVKERRRAIYMLEAAIETYERLLGLLLKEAKGGDIKEEEDKILDPSL